MDSTDVNRFWSKVNKTATCWLWTASTTTEGYGYFAWRGKNRRAHRVSWMLAVGDDDLPTHLVLHRCDTPGCVNPAHLFLGTSRDNSTDMVAKGRSASGVRHPGARLTIDAVRAIRAEVAAGASISSLAAKHGVDRHTVRDIRDRRLWRSLP